jgi:hypothetical protein
VGDSSVRKTSKIRVVVHLMHLVDLRPSGTLQIKFEYYTNLANNLGDARKMLSMVQSDDMLVLVAHPSFPPTHFSKTDC